MFTNHLFCGLTEAEAAIELQDELASLPEIVYG